MDSVMEKFDLLDFFNLIIAGAVFLIGLGFYDNDIQCHLNRILCMGGKSTFSTILMIVLFIALSYIIGLVFNALGLLILKNRYHDKLVGECLKDSSVVGNTAKLKIYRKNANDFFRANKIFINDNQFDNAQCSCFFAHCVYFIQARAQNQKAEKLRDVQGLSMVLMVSFGTLAVVAGFFVQKNFTSILMGSVYGLILIFPILEWCLRKKGSPKKDRIRNKLRLVYRIALVIMALILEIIFLMWNDLTCKQKLTTMASGVLAYLFYCKYRQDVSNRVRMVLAVYDICKDMKDS